VTKKMLERSSVRTLVSLGLASAIWLPSLHLLFRPDVDDYLKTDGIAPRARALAARQMEVWANPAAGHHEIEKMRGSNAEWDFMGRTFLVLAMANMALRDPGGQARYLARIDSIIEETIRVEREKGLYFFLMDYARDRPFVESPPRSLFVDGEIALMLGARRVVSENKRYKRLLRQRVKLIVERMQRGPVKCAESYPDECWMFCNTVALAAVKIADILDRTDHTALFDDWLRTARERLVDPRTGLLISSFTLDGARRDGPEGSSIWMAAHCLELIDEAFARDQYARARRELGGNLLGFGFAREWPRSSEGPADIDSGPIVPLLGASPGSSGLALVGAAAFGDRDYFAELCASLNFAAFPVEEDGTLRFAASNQVGDAVMLYAMVLGPLWREVKRRARS
jgi:hypothetical protein